MSVILRLRPPQEKLLGGRFNEKGSFFILFCSASCVQIFLLLKALIWIYTERMLIKEKCVRAECIDRQQQRGIFFKHVKIQLALQRLFEHF